MTVYYVINSEDSHHDPKQYSAGPDILTAARPASKGTNLLYIGAQPAPSALSHRRLA